MHRKPAVAKTSKIADSAFPRGSLISRPECLSRSLPSAVTQVCVPSRRLQVRPLVADAPLAGVQNRRLLHAQLRIVNRKEVRVSSHQRQT